jgi:hypothetical protein
LPVTRVAPGDSASPLVLNPLCLSFWVSAALLVVLFAANRGRMRFAADYLLAAFFLYQGARHWRLLPLFAIACAGPAAYLATQLVGRFSDRIQRTMRTGLLAFTAALALIFIFAVREPISFFQRNLQLARGEVMELSDYPEPMMKFILRTRFPDRMFSQINYCGYAMWWLSPETHKLFTDNRFDLFGGQFYPYEATVVHGVEKDQSITPDRLGWSEILDKYGVNFVVMERGAPVDAKLRESANWTHVYYYIPPHARSRDAGFSIYLRNDPRFADVRDRALANFRDVNPGWPMPDELDAGTSASAHQ